jgi:Ca2+-binding RTX toxin-like protein
VTLSGAAEGITLDAADGASGPELVAAVAGGALPRTVNGVFDSTTGSFRPVEILGGASNNVIALTDFGMVDGGAGNDIIDAVGGGWFSHPAGGNFLYGGAGDDGITGSGDGDLISGGPGNDRLAGYAGDDTFYFFAADAGIDVVNEVTWYLWDTYDGAVRATALYNADSGRESEDTVEFSEGISLDGLTLSWGTYDSRYTWWSPLPLRTYDTLDIYWGPDRGVQVMLPDRFDADVAKDMTIHSPGSSWGIEHFKFADGTTLSFQDMADRIPTPVLNGTGGDDLLEGSAGNNEFLGGGGIDKLYGAFASDTYYFNLGDGEDWIRDPGGTDRIVFGAGITPEMLSLGSGSMLVRIGTGGDALHIEYFDPDDPFRTGAIETYEFAGRLTLTHAQLLERGFDVYGSDAAETLTGTGVTDRMYGLGGDDTLAGGAGYDVLDGGPGNDLLAGGEGSDTYRFDFGTGFDTVVETEAQGGDADIVLLGPGITNEHLNVARAGGDMVLTLGGGSDRLTISNWFTAPGYRIERVEFAHGSAWDAAMLEWLAFLSNRTPLATVEIDDQTAYEDAQFFFAVPGDTFADPDVGDALTYTASQADGTSLPEWLAFDSATRSFSGKPAQSDVGSVDVRVVATDLWGASAQEIFELTILNTNDAPVLAHAIPDQVASAGAPFNFILAADTFADQDPGDTLTLSAVRLDASAPPIPIPPRPPHSLPPPSDGGSPLPAWLQFGASAQSFSGTPTDDDVGTLEIRVTATDGSGASVSDVFVITVASGNNPPVVANPIPDQEATEDAPFSFTVPSNAITDPDAGDTLTWSAESSNGELLPGWLTFDAVNRVFTGTPANDDDGSFSVRVTATDSSDASASDVFDITVTNTNDAPTLEQEIADQPATEDEPFTLELPSGMFGDVDAGDTLTLSATLPAWLTLDGNVLSGTPLNADVGEFHVKLIATDLAGATAFDEFCVTVANVNDAPVTAAALADQSFEADATFTFTVSAETFVDEDAGDSLSYSASSFGGGALPSWLTFDAATATFRGNPVIADIGISHIAVSATDTSGASVISDFGLIVRAPAGSTVRGSAGGDLIYGGTGDETLVGKAGDDMLFGDVGDDVLRGGAGVDVLQGGEGSDVMHGGTGNNVLDGGSGDDLIFDGSGDSFISGGAGNDTIKMGTGKDVIAFNSGDGWDTIIGGGDGGNTLSLGGGIRYSDLSFSRVGDDLVMNTGQNEGIVLNDWYAGAQSVLNLQIILDATDEFDAGSSDPLYNRRVQTFSFLGLVSAFDQARIASPGLTSWDVTNALLQWQLWGADDAALGGDLAYWYGRNRTLAGISLQAAQQVIGASGFGSDAHTLRPFSGLQEGFVKLG